MDNRNNVNQLVEYMEAAIKDDTSNKEEIEILDDPLRTMWSIFYGPLTAVEIQNQGRALKIWKTILQASCSQLKSIISEVSPSRTSQTN
jgi:hypothetical protein